MCGHQESAERRDLAAEGKQQQQRWPGGELNIAKVVFLRLREGEGARENIRAEVFSLTSCRLAGSSSFEEF